MISRYILILLLALVTAGAAAATGVYILGYPRQAMRAPDSLHIESVELCASDCMYPSPFIEAALRLNSTSPLVSVGYYVNSTYEGKVSFDYTWSGAAGVWFKASACNSAVYIESNHTYLVTFVATFRDGSSASASATAVAGVGSGISSPSCYA